MTKTIITLIALALVFVAACSRTDSSGDQMQLPTYPPGSDEPALLDEDLAATDKLLQDLSTEELDTIEQELTDVETADV